MRHLSYVISPIDALPRIDVCCFPPSDGPHIYVVPLIDVIAPCNSWIA